MEQAAGQIMEYISGNKDARIECYDIHINVCLSSVFLMYNMRYIRFHYRFIKRWRTRSITAAAMVRLPAI